jgi:transposase InsO family protein
MKPHGLSERRALQIIGMSASSLRYQPAPDRNGELREQIVHLAQRHRRYGAGMIYLKLRQAGCLVKHKRVERLYAQEKLQVRRRRRKKIPMSERQPLPTENHENAAAVGRSPLTQQQLLPSGVSLLLKQGKAQGLSPPGTCGRG